MSFKVPLVSSGWGHIFNGIDNSGADRINKILDTAFHEEIVSTLQASKDTSYKKQVSIEKYIQRLIEFLAVPDIKHDEYMAWSFELTAATERLKEITKK